MGKKRQVISRKEIFFLAKFFVIFAVGEALLPFLPLYPVESAITSLNASALGLQAQGNTVLINGEAFVISEHCSGAVSSLILFAIIFSLRKPDWKTRLWMWAGGTIILFLANIFRILFVLLSAIILGRNIAEIVHVASWFAVSALIIAIWFFETKKIAKIEQFSELL